MTVTWKERFINALVSLIWAVLVLIASTQISFKYTRNYVNKLDNKLDQVIEKADSILLKLK